MHNDGQQGRQHIGVIGIGGGVGWERLRFKESAGYDLPAELQCIFLIL